MDWSLKKNIIFQNSGPMTHGIIIYFLIQKKLYSDQ